MGYLKNALWGLSVLGLAILCFINHTLWDQSFDKLLTSDKKQNITYVATQILPTAEKINLLFEKEVNIKPYTNADLNYLTKKLTDIIDSTCETRECEQYFAFSSQRWLGNPISNYFDADAWFDKVRHTSNNNLIEQVASHYNNFFIHTLIATIILLIMIFRIINIKTISLSKCLLVLGFFAPIYTYFVNIGGSTIDHLYSNPISVAGYNNLTVEFYLYVVLVVYVAIIYPVIFRYIKNHKLRIKELIL
jgi:hypothetical protein